RLFTRSSAWPSRCRWPGTSSSGEAAPSVRHPSDADRGREALIWRAMDAPVFKATPQTGIPLPSTSAESITMLAHYYRGEVTRMISWRDRLDRTTNWAIAAMAAMLSFSLSSQQAHHSVLLFCMLLIYGLLVIEARRYRFYDVYRARVRKLESE